MRTREMHLPTIATNDPDDNERRETRLRVHRDAIIATELKDR